MDTGLTGQATAQHVSAERSPFRERMRRFTQWSRRHPRIAWVTGATVVGLALFLCFLRLSWTYPAGSDGADQALQAWDMLHGNWLLRGWTIADVTYYTTEIPQYMLIELIKGLGPDVEHIAAASTYTLLLLAAGLLARGRSTGREGLIRFAVAAGIMIAPQFGNATHLLLSQPDHLGTQLPLLLAFLLLDRAPRRWYVPVAVGAILTLVVIADQVAMLTAAVPLAIVCGARALLGVVCHRKSLASQWYELSLVAVAVLSYAAAKLAVRLIIDLHGYHVLPIATKRTPIADIRAARRTDGGGNPQRFRRRLPPPLELFPARSQPGRPADGRRNRPRRGAPGRRGAGGVGLLPRVPVLLRPQRPGLPRPGHGARRQRRRLRAQRRPRHAVRHQGDRGRAALRRRPGRAHGPRDADPVAATAEAGAGLGLSGCAGLLCGRARLWHRPSPGSGLRPGDRSLAGGAPPHHRARYLLRGEPHHDGQRGPCRGQDGVVAIHPRRPAPLRVQGRLVRPPAKLCQLHRDEHRRQHPEPRREPSPQFP